MSKKIQKDIAFNRQARFEYEILETFETGIVLQGTEVKSVRAGQVNLKDSYIRIINNEVWLINTHISEYVAGNLWNHEPRRERKLLMHRREINRLRAKVDERGFTLVPLRMYLKNGMIKLEIALARGKAQFDKRKDIAKRDVQREMQRELKQKYRVKI